MRLPAVLLLVLLANAAGAMEVRGIVEPTDLTKFNLTRVEYDSIGGYGEAYYRFEGRIWSRWETDFPQAENNFAKRLGELTRLHASRAPAKHRRLTDSDLGDFPLLFMSDVGWMHATREEVEGLRTYLANGGFLWVDDFWGDAEWKSFERFMREVLPSKHWREVPVAHPIFHTVFEIEEMPQIPAESYSRRPTTTEPSWGHRYPTGSMVRPTMRGYFDDEGRLMVIGTHNTDVADGWEREAYGQFYFERFSTKSYQLGVNVYTYVVTH